MKLIVPVVFASSALAPVFAGECTLDELTTIGNIYNSAMTDACPDMISGSDATSPDFCSQECMQFNSEAYDKLPDCSTGEFNIKAAMEATIDYCKTGKADVSEILAGSKSFKSDSSISDKITDSTTPPATEGSMASSKDLTSSSVIFAVVVLVIAAGL